MDHAIHGPLTFLGGLPVLLCLGCPGEFTHFAPIGINPRRFWWRKVTLTAQNPRRHAAGKPFHGFLAGWLGAASPRSDSEERICCRREVDMRIERARFSAWCPRPCQRGWLPPLPLSAVGF